MADPSEIKMELLCPIILLVAAFFCHPAWTGIVCSFFAGTATVEILRK